MKRRYIDTIKATIVREAETDNSQNSRHWDANALPEREFFASDVEGVESICAVGAVFEEVFLGLPKVGLIARTGYATSERQLWRILRISARIGIEELLQHSAY